MIREIRFRAWDSIEKKMWKPIIKPDGSLMASNQFGGYKTFYGDQDPLMQYTGLKDKNGKEIYCGDILSFEAKEWYGEFFDVSEQVDHIFQVEQSETGEWVGAGLCTDWPSFCELIGNIYENSELLEEKE